MPDRVAKKASLSFKTSTSWLFAEAKSDNAVFSAPRALTAVDQSKPAAASAVGSERAAEEIQAQGPQRFNEEEQQLPPKFSDEYEVIDQIGEGAVCNVYRVKSSSLKREFALKVLKDELLSNNAALKQFKKEVNASTDLTHVNIAAVYGYGHTSNGAPFVVTQMCEGINLAHAIRNDGPFDPPRALKLFIQISDAMAHAHFKSVVHRDLKPSNVVLSREENGEEIARVIDFGMATVLQSARSAVTDVTKTGEVFGSPHYMSPEQCRGDKVDERSDIYSFGCLMHEVLNGRQPFAGLNLVQVIMRQLNEKAPEFEETLPRSRQLSQLENIVHRCLEKDPSQRYQTFDQLKRELETVLDGGTIEVAATATDPLASPGARLTASCIDGLILAILIYPLSLVTDFTTATAGNHVLHDYWQVWLALSPEWWAVNVVWRIGSLFHLVDANDFLAGVYLAISFIYHVFFEFTAVRATPGKFLMGLTVANARGERISLFRAVLRFFAGLLSVPIAGLFLTQILLPNRFRIDRPPTDAWSDSYVVKRKQLAEFAASGPQGFYSDKMMNLEMVHRKFKAVSLMYVASLMALLIAAVEQQWYWFAPLLVAWIPYLVSLHARKEEILLERKKASPEARSWWTGLLRNTLHGKAEE